MFLTPIFSSHMRYPVSTEIQVDILWSFIEDPFSEANSHSAVQITSFYGT
jgi:hypothetical protein